MNKEKSEPFWAKREFVAVVSLLLAVLVWLTVTMVIDTNTTKTFSNIKVDFTYDSRQYTALGLDIVNQPEAVVSVKLDGGGTTLGAISEKDIVVYPDYSAVKSAGAQQLNLVVRIVNSRYSSSVQADIVSGSRTVMVVFDTIVSKNFAIEPDVEGLTLAENYALNRTVCSPLEVTVTGPEGEVNKIDRAVAQVKMDGTVTESVTRKADIELQDADGNPITLEYAEMNITETDVVMTVYLQKELPLSINFINVPPSFDFSNLHYTLSQETMMVAGPAKQVEALDKIDVASFDLSTFVMNQSYQLAVELPSGLVATEDIANVTLQIDDSDYITRTMNVNNIRTVNIPVGVEAEPQTKRLTNVTVVGPRSSVESLTPGNLEALLDGSDITVTSGLENVPATISIPSRSDVFVVGTYSVQCQVSGGSSE